MTCDVPEIDKWENLFCTQHQESTPAIPVSSIMALQPTYRINVFMLAVALQESSGAQSYLAENTGLPSGHPNVRCIEMPPRSMLLVELEAKKGKTPSPSKVVLFVGERFGNFLGRFEQ
jgi:hypothetical protein